RPDGEQPQVRARDVHVAQRRAAARRGDGLVAAGYRQRAGLVARPAGSAVGKHELDVALRAPEAAGIVVAGAWWREVRRCDAQARRRTAAGAAPRELGDRPGPIA